MTGTIGAFASAIIIKKIGNNYSFLVTPICFAFAAFAWRFVDATFDEGGPNAKEVTGELADEGLDTAPVKRGFIGYLERFVAPALLYRNRLTDGDDGTSNL